MAIDGALEFTELEGEGSVDKGSLYAVEDSTFPELMSSRIFFSLAKVASWRLFSSFTSFFNSSALASCFFLRCKAIIRSPISVILDGMPFLKRLTLIIKNMS